MTAPTRTWTRCCCCDYVWFLTHPDRKPAQCPRCRTRNWAPVTGRWRHSGTPTTVPFGSAVWTCARCGWAWITQNLTGEASMPRRCALPACATPYWHRPRRARTADAA
jgi:hypothetical protein